MGLLSCFLYVAFLAVVSFPLGRLAALVKYKTERFPFKERAFEKKLYERLKVKVWKDRVPDMSKVLPAMIPSKDAASHKKDDLPGMINETCVAELTHWFLAIFGIGCVFIWKGIGGIICALLFMLGNFPFILIQRYNRPRLIKVQNRCSI